MMLMVVLLVLGVLSMVYGISLWSPAAAFVALGLMLVIASVLPLRGRIL